MYMKGWLRNDISNIHIPTPTLTCRFIIRIIKAETMFRKDGSERTYPIYMPTPTYICRFVIDIIKAAMFRKDGSERTYPIYIYPHLPIFAGALFVLTRQLCSERMTQKGHIRYTNTHMSPTYICRCVIRIINAYLLKNIRFFNQNIEHLRLGAAQ